jgi:hypothetical protein
LALVRELRLSMNQGCWSEEWFGTKFEDHPDSARVRFRDQPFEIADVAEDGIDINVIGDVLAQVGHW